MHVIHKQKNNCHASNTNYFSRMRKCFSRSHLAIQIFPDYDGYSSWKTKTKIRSKKRDASKNHYFKIIKGYFSLRLSLVIGAGHLIISTILLPLWCLFQCDDISGGHYIDIMQIQSWNCIPWPLYASLYELIV